MQNRLALAVLAIGLASPAVAAEPPTFACAPPFAQAMTAETLAEAFGAENLHTGPLMGPEGEFYEATVIHPTDIRKQVIVAWIDAEGHRDPESISVRGESDWIGPAGLRLGVGLDEVAAANGERFELYGFGWDYGGLAEIKSGRLAELAGGCMLELAFDPSPDAPFTEVIGETLFWSDDPGMVAARPRLYEMRLRFVGEAEK